MGWETSDCRPETHYYGLPCANVGAQSSPVVLRKTLLVGPARLHPGALQPTSCLPKSCISPRVFSRNEVRLDFYFALSWDSVTVLIHLVLKSPPLTIT